MINVIQKVSSSRTRSINRSVSGTHSSSGNTQFKDNRSEFITQRKLQQVLNSSNTKQPPGKSTNIGMTAQRVHNNTGLPDSLKSGLEHMSGLSMADVKVHYNSDKPAQLNAHAFAQGADIHIAPGQNKHLPHEAWHVVQQKQGRVKPTLSLGGQAINDDVGLEKEADIMGNKATSVQLMATESLENQELSKSLIQLKVYKLNGLDGGNVNLRSKAPNKDHQGYNTLTHATKVGDLLATNDLAEPNIGDQFLSRTDAHDQYNEQPNALWTRLLAFQKLGNPVIDTSSEQYYIPVAELGAQEADIDSLEDGVGIFADEEYAEAQYRHSLDEDVEEENQEDFRQTWNMVADPQHVIGDFEVASNINVLVISEGKKGERNTGSKFEKATNTVDRTYYDDGNVNAEDFPVSEVGEGQTESWDIHDEPPFEYMKYDLVIARSSICMCTSDSFACGGYDKSSDAHAIAALNRIANLLKPGGTAVLTTGTLHITGGDFTSDRSVASSALGGKKMPKRPDSKRFDARYNTYKYWSDLFGNMEVSSEVEISPILMGTIPQEMFHGNTQHDIPNSLFAIVIHRKSDPGDGQFRDAPTGW